MTAPTPEGRDFRRDEVIAGEYVLGVLSADDRRKVEARLASDRNFAAMVDRWQSNLSSFDEAYDLVVPPPRAFSAIERRLFETSQPEPIQPRRGLWNSLAVWRGLALASLAALVVMGASMAGLFKEPSAGTPLIAELTGKGSAVDLVARYDRASGRLKVTPVAARQAEQKSLELWLINGSNPAISLGVLPQSGEGEIAVPSAFQARISAGSVLAVSVEPLGGSPTGSATGPIIALGKARSL
ncbi:MULTISPECIES: anti-sigma factor [unclassified Ensifer]|uniref:anti-sigma factor n=1 Tax=unclassified Ensifer TaxID=2633371 RepID=UPI000812D76E|nr:MULTISPECIES: anti-sigma factor [unclassified Ensifer]OCO98283.1 anti-sigma factor [Ensifer sp. LC13]OCP05163.1 anti-sigma factor [Ensifer sp. LC14]OCP14516.1 anti-sigma factor [Ensifer sp. LC11]OCP29176.1 anti-sigma factor [Ensifer sp. LC499]